MDMHKRTAAAWLMAGVMAGMSIAVAPQLTQAQDHDSTAARLQRLEARAEIEDLFASYGATLDRHDFPAFGALFAEDAVYAGGPGEPTHGRAAIQAMLEKQITSNPSHLPMPDFHLYFSPIIKVTGDHATAMSKGAYVIPDLANNGARIVFFVQYEDALVRKDGHWLFASRTIHGGIPAPQAK
jgi:uncharacterized protein (TIGR02246 family)